MSRVWRRKTSPVPATVGIQAPPRHHRGTTTAHNSPRRDGVTYAEVTGGAGGQHSFIMEALATTRSPPHLSSEDEERGWEDVHFKRKRRDDERRASPPLGLCTRQGSPPYIRTPAGLVEVCGQCLKPGHMAAECRRAITCRSCGGTGHKGRNCPQRGSNHHQMMETKEIRRPTRHASPERRREPPGNPRQPELEKPQQAKHPKEGHTTRLISHHHVIVEDPHKAGQPTKTAGPEKKKAPPSRKIEHLHSSLALDGDMVEGKEEMKIFTVATVTKIKGGFVTGRSPAEAREMEKSGELHFPTFTIKCNLWTADIWRIGPADGEIRWLDVRRLPTFCWNRDSAGRILKAIGDLLYVDRRGGSYVDDFRALVRIRRGRTMPCILWTSIGSRKYKVLVGMERGQEQLPWNGGEMGEIGDDMEEEEEGQNHPKRSETKQEKSQERRKEKGKQTVYWTEKRKEKPAGEDHYHVAATSRSMDKEK
ncbi:hypothetical protein J5N97_017490 [Dioscorea zingiberensis]|uniref:CCHC-type domain-containing protein n=1 Tax=Dioscorea zingiberensis TaxID=325984 RepID=A0A9D5HGF2_9LILI|nr:hypothetical protein J5N97_017490 [Dioscorea zingiberensis]